MKITRIVNADQDKCFELQQQNKEETQNNSWDKLISNFTYKSLTYKLQSIDENLCMKFKLEAQSVFKSGSRKEEYLDIQQQKSFPQTDRLKSLSTILTQRQLNHIMPILSERNGEQQSKMLHDNISFSVKVIDKNFKQQNYSVNQFGLEQKNQNTTIQTHLLMGTLEHIKKEGNVCLKVNDILLQGGDADKLHLDIGYEHFIFKLSKQFIMVLYGLKQKSIDQKRTTGLVLDDYYFPFNVTKMIFSFLNDDNSVKPFKIVDISSNSYKTLIKVPTWSQQKQTEEKVITLTENDSFHLARIFELNVRRICLFKEVFSLKDINPIVLKARFMNQVAIGNEDKLAKYPCVFQLCYLLQDVYKSTKLAGLNTVQRKIFDRIQTKCKNPYLYTENKLKKIDEIIQSIAECHALVLDVPFNQKQIENAESLMIIHTSASLNRTYSFGRQSDCDFYIKNPQISRYHAYIRLMIKESNSLPCWQVLDGAQFDPAFNSSNGTFKALKKFNEYDIYNGQSLFVGENEISFECKESNGQRQNQMTKLATLPDDYLNEELLSGLG